MVKYIVVVMCLLSATTALFSFFSIKNISDVKAKDVRFDGKKIILTGDVIIEGRLGIIHCEKAELFLPDFSESSNSDKNASSATSPALSPERILLQNSVTFELTDGSRLTSDEADINCIDLEGVFSAKPPHKVVYVAYVEEEGVRVPVKTTSTIMRVKMKKDEKSSAYVLSDVQGEGAVTIEYQPKGSLGL